MDHCVESSVAFISSLTNDIDGDGCHDISEDTDDDDDGRPDTSDRCSRGLIGWNSSDTLLDHDSDGCLDDNDEDRDDDKYHLHIGETGYFIHSHDHNVIAKPRKQRRFAMRCVTDK